MYAGYRKTSERQRQQQEAAAQLKQSLVQDLQNLSKMEVKPMTGRSIRSSGQFPKHRQSMNLSSLLPTFVSSANNLHNVLLPVCLVLGFGGLVYKCAAHVSGAILAKRLAVYGKDVASRFVRLAYHEHAGVPIGHWIWSMT